MPLHTSRIPEIPLKVLTKTLSTPVNRHRLAFVSSEGQKILSPVFWNKALAGKILVVLAYSEILHVFSIYIYELTSDDSFRPVMMNTKCAHMLYNCQGGEAA